MTHDVMTWVLVAQSPGFATPQTTPLFSPLYWAIAAIGVALFLCGVVYVRRYERGRAIGRRAEMQALRDTVTNAVEALEGAADASGDAELAADGRAEADAARAALAEVGEDASRVAEMRLRGLVDDVRAAERDVRAEA